MPWLSKTKIILIILILIGVVFHFYNLNWGAPFYFHPDERNVASAVSQLTFPGKMNPNFFAYGSLPIYVIYFSGQFQNLLSSLFQHVPSSPQTTFEQAIHISRLYSAFFATLLIPILFSLGKKLKNETVGLIVAFLATTSVGFIQFAHFGTFEMWLTFFSVLFFWICLEKITKKNLLLMGIVFGILVAIKISSLALLPLIILVFLIQNTRKNQTTRKTNLSDYLKIRRSDLLNILSFLKRTTFVLIVGFFVYYLTNPFVFLDTDSFKNSMDYESSLAIGTLPVFYTGEFFNTIPVVFQFINIYPFLLNPLITVLFIPSFAYLIYKIVKTKSTSYFLLLAFFLILFLSQAFLFAKWTRYMIPTLPFVFLIVGIAVNDFLNKTRRPLIYQFSLISLIIINILFGFSYFVTAFIRPDTRVAASQFAQKVVPFDSLILSEVYDLGIVPFNDSYHNILLFNFYDLDNNSPEATPYVLQQHLAQREYIILPSQRIIKPRLMNEKKFPLGHSFYSKLVAGKLGYKKIYETPCDIFCKITYLGDPAFRFEETANVFDRPTVLIFEKQ